jgi:hypothetical protein
MDSRCLRRIRGNDDPVRIYDKKGILRYVIVKVSEIV